MSAPDTTARKGKIGRMPKTVRDELNARLRDGESSATILPWLNAMPAVKAILKKRWRAEAVSDQNLSAWRNGGYKEWLQRQDELDQTKGLVEFSADLTRKTGGSPADAAANLSGSRLLAALDEHLTPSAISELLADRPKDLLSLVEKVVQLQAEENRKAAVTLNVQKFQWDAAEAVEKIGVKQLADILNSSDPHPIKMDKLIRLMFGKRPDAPTGPMAGVA